MSHMDEWDAEKMFNLYLLDLLVKRNMHESAEMFAKEAKIDSSLPVIDSPVGFLYEWWVMFFDAYFSQQISQELANEQQVENKGKQIIGSQNEPQDHQSQVLKFEIAKLLGQLEANSLVPKMFELEPAHNIGGFASSSQFPVFDFPNLHIAAGSNMCNNDPQQLLPPQMMLNLGSIANDLEFGAQKAMSGLHGSVNTGMEHVLNTQTLQGWPLLSGSQVSPYMGQSVIPLYLQQSNLEPQVQLPSTSSEQEILVEPKEWIEYTPGCGSLTSSLPGSSSDLNSRNLKNLQNGLGGSFGQLG